MAGPGAGPPQPRRWRARLTVRLGQGRHRATRGGAQAKQAQQNADFNADKGAWLGLSRGAGRVSPTATRPMWPAHESKWGASSRRVSPVRQARPPSRPCVGGKRAGAGTLSARLRRLPQRAALGARTCLSARRDGGAH